MQPASSLLGVRLGATAINTTDVRIGDILKLKKPVIVTVAGQSNGKTFPVDTVFKSAPVTKITKNAIFLTGKDKATGNPLDVWIVKDPSAYIVVDSDTSFLRTVSITVDNQGTTLAQPIVNAAAAVKEGVSNAIDKAESIGSGLLTAGKWILVGVLVVGGVILIGEVKSFTKAAKE